MKNLKIVKTYDFYECECCGYSGAEGYKAYLDGELISEFEPRAYCFDGETISFESMMVDILKKMEINLSFEEEE